MDVPGYRLSLFLLCPYYSNYHVVLALQFFYVPRHVLKALGKVFNNLGNLGRQALCPLSGSGKFPVPKGQLVPLLPKLSFLLLQFLVAVPQLHSRFIGFFHILFIMDMKVPAGYEKLVPGQLFLVLEAVHLFYNLVYFLAYFLEVIFQFLALVAYLSAYFIYFSLAFLYLLYG